MEDPLGLAWLSSGYYFILLRQIMDYLEAVNIGAKILCESG
jgi:hypothetical protein